MKPAKPVKAPNPEKDRRMVPGIGSARFELRQGRQGGVAKTKRGSK